MNAYLKCLVFFLVFVLLVCLSTLVALAAQATLGPCSLDGFCQGRSVKNPIHIHLRSLRSLRSLTPPKNTKNPNNPNNVVRERVRFFRLFPVFHVEQSRRGTMGRCAHASPLTRPSRPSVKANEVPAAVQLRATRTCSPMPTPTYVQRRSSEVIHGVTPRVGSHRGHVARNRAGTTNVTPPLHGTVRMFDRVAQAQDGGVGARKGKG